MPKYRISTQDWSLNTSGNYLYQFMLVTKRTLLWVWTKLWWWQVLTSFEVKNMVSFQYSPLLTSMRWQTYAHMLLSWFAMLSCDSEHTNRNHNIALFYATQVAMKEFFPDRYGLGVLYVAVRAKHGHVSTYSQTSLEHGMRTLMHNKNVPQQGAS